MKLPRWLAHPLTRDVDLDDPRTTDARAAIIREKRFLRRIYDEWYRELAVLIPANGGPALELGAGGGFADERISGLVKTDVIATGGIHAVASAESLPFVSGSLRAIVMTNVLHHIPRPLVFLEEAQRVLRPGGVVAMLEPWVTPWSTLVYRRLHHEPFEPGASWQFEGTRPLSDANGAIPWILFQRDRRALEKHLGHLHVEVLRPVMPLAYLMSGGLATRAGAPGFLFPALRAAERLLGPLSSKCAMFAYIALRRR